MYYVNREQIELRLKFIPWVVEALELLKKESNVTDPLHVLAQERAVHLAIEAVTDIGSLLIDAFLMRDASSYEDIIEVLRGEEVFPEAVTTTLLELVKLRKPLVQDYITLERQRLLPLIDVLPEALMQFTASIQLYLRQQLP